jgi:hypothetical protein
MKKHISILLSVAAAAAVSPLSAATVSYWQLDESSGNLVDAVGGNNLSGASGLSYSQTALVDPVPNPDGTVGAANPGSISFSSASLAPRTTVVAPFAITTSNAFTFEGWLLHDVTDGTQSGLEYIGGDRSRNSTPSTYRGWHVVVTGGLVQVFSEGTTLDSTFRIDDASAHHFAVVWDSSTGGASDGTMSLYVDGAFQASGTVTPVAGYTAPGFSIGGRHTGTDGTYNDSFLQGNLDELRFSDTALAPSEFLNVPEPSAVLLGGLGLLALLRRRRD